MALLVLCLGTRARAQKWERLGPEGGMVVSLGAGSANDLYLGTSDGHIFGSADAGKSWELRGRVGVRIDAVVTRIVVDPRNASRVLAAVWYQQAGARGGVFESGDRGKTWRPMGLDGEVVRALEMAPSKPDELVAGTRTGVFLSSDNGKNWTRISPEGDEELRNLDSLAIDPRDPQVIYAGTYHLPWLTRDAGKTWKPVIAGIIDDSDIMSLRLDASNPDRLYMSACSGIYRSENQGGQWTKMQGIPYLARRTQVIAQDAANPKTLYAGTTEGLWVTRDGGESWTRTTPREWAVNSLVVLQGGNGAPGRVVMGTEGQGVLISEDAGASFAQANHGFTHVIVNKLVADESDPQHLLMVVEGGPAVMLESHDEGKSWSAVSMSTEERGKTTPLNANLIEGIYAGPWGLRLRMDDGRIWMLEAGGDPRWKEWTLRLAVAPKPRAAAGKPAANNPVTEKVVTQPTVQFLEEFAVLATNQGLLRCDYKGYCRRLKAFGKSERVDALWVSRTSEEIAVVADGKFAWSSDGGISAKWNDLPPEAGQSNWLCISHSGTRKGIYLGTSNGVFSSPDGDSWQRVGGGLPAGQAGAWLRGRKAWAASERGGGLYISEDEGHSWWRADSDAERSRIIALLETQEGAILVGSQSEGLLQLRLEQPSQTQR